MPRTPRIVTLVLTALVLLLAGATSARAQSDQAFPIAGADFQRAQQIAQAHWGAVPCNGQVAFTWSGMEPLTNARATWSNPTDAWNNAGANFDCRVAFNTIARFDFPMLCTVMTHELGHLLGRAHDPNDGQLMSAIYSTPLPECGDGAAAPAGPVADAAAATGEEIAWDVRESKAKKASKKRKIAKKTRKRCVVRYKAGKRVKRCVVLKKSSKRTVRTSRRSG